MSLLTHRSFRFVLATVGTSIATVGFCACGGSEVRVIVRIAGGAPITTGELADWMRVEAPEHIVPDPPRFATCVAKRRESTLEPVRSTLEHECMTAYRALRRRAVEYLITSRWLTGEAREHGLTPTETELAQGLKRKERSLFIGDAGLHAYLQASGRTIGDVNLEVKRDLIATKLAEMLEAQEPGVDLRHAAAYYTHHTREFERPERRYVEIVEELNTLGEAQKLIADAQKGRSISTISIHESLERPSNSEAPPLVRAIFAAKKGLIGTPVEEGRRYFVVMVNRIVRARRESLAAARDAIDRRLATERKRRVLRRFIESWRRRWRARTSCRPGYVVQKCQQYDGPMAQEDSWSFR